MTRAAALIVNVDAQDVDGMVYMRSPDVPGLHVCGATYEEACESAMTAIKYLFKMNVGQDVTVSPAAASMDQFAQPISRCQRFVAIAA